MRAYQCETPGIEGLKLNEIDKPTPGPGEVLLQMKAMSLNARDKAVVGGGYPAKRPLVPLSDGVGIIVEVGPGVTEFSVGQRVAPMFAPGWENGGPVASSMARALGGALNGTLREYMTCNQTEVALVPEHLSDVEAATLPCSALTAWSALVKVTGLKAGETVLLEGTGGVSLFALQFAKMIGARVAIVSSSDEKLERAKALGADVTVNYATTPEWGQAVLAATGGVNVAVEVGGPATFVQALGSLAFGGRIAQIGLLTGVDAALPLRLVVPKAVSIQGVLVGSRASFREMVAAMSLNNIKPVIDKTFAFEDATAAITSIGGGAFGKIAIAV